MRPLAASAIGLSGLALLSGLAASSQTRMPAAPDPREFQQKVRPLVGKYCLGCHNASHKEAGVDLSGVNDPAAALRQRRLWKRAAARIAAGEMPPPGAKDPSKKDRDLLVRWMQAAAAHLDPKDPSAGDPGPSLLRRLTRTEYNLTIRDLFGLDFDSAQEVGMPDSEVTTGFTNLAAALNLSPALLDKYLAAADKIADRVFRDGRARQQLLSVAEGEGLGERERASQILARLLRRAYRRPARPVEVERLLAVYDRAAREGGFEAGVRGALRPVLISPHFLFRVEGDPAGPAPARVSDHELAVRLAYFLWSRMPDDTLATLADQGKLSDPAVLEAQVARMLADPRAQALTEGFGKQWLQFGAVQNARPSTEFFPAFTLRLRRAMYDETATFFDHLRTEDRSILELLDADYTYVNAELAKHYGIEGVSGTQMQRVILKPEHHRGGLLGMGSVLALTSHTHRTSPTQRGKYVLEVLFGTPPPPPPPQAGLLKEDKGKEPRNFREQLARHASDAACAGCHRKMDPLGFALDNYDAVGAWRESTSDRPLDTTGELPTGEKLKGAADLKQVILSRRGEFARNMAAQLLSYALGRELVDSDDYTLHGLETDLERGGYRFSVLVRGIVNSIPFQHRRPTEP